jgi:hypothetical protein
MTDKFQVPEEYHQHYLLGITVVTAVPIPNKAENTRAIASRSGVTRAMRPMNRAHHATDPTSNTRKEVVLFIIQPAGRQANEKIDDMTWYGDMMAAILTASLMKRTAMLGV